MTPKEIKDFLVLKKDAIIFVHKKTNYKSDYQQGLSQGRITMIVDIIEFLNKNLK